MQLHSKCFKSGQKAPRAGGLAHISKSKQQRAPKEQVCCKHSVVHLGDRLDSLLVMTAPAFCGNTARRPHLHTPSSLPEQSSACLPSLMLHAGRRLQSQLVSLSAWRGARSGAAPPCCAHLSAAGEARPCSPKTCSAYTSPCAAVCICAQPCSALTRACAAVTTNVDEPVSRAALTSMYCARSAAGRASGACHRGCCAWKL